MDGGGVLMFSESVTCDCYWLYIMTNCLPGEAAAKAGGLKPVLHEPIKDPARFPWHEVTNVQHYWLQVDAMTGGYECGGG